MATSKQNFVLTRTFKAPKQLIFDAFSTAEALAKWWGPVSSPIDVITLDFRPGGIFHYRMNGVHESYGIFRYIEIDRPNSITWINSFANEKGEVIKTPFEGIDLPEEILNRISLTEQDGVTTLLLSSEPVNASDPQIATFKALTDNMKQGFGGTLDQLESYLNAIL